MEYIAYVAAVGVLLIAIFSFLGLFSIYLKDKVQCCINLAIIFLIAITYFFHPDLVECEKDLARNTGCIMVFIPEDFK